MNDTSRHVDDTTSAALRERLAPNEMVQTQRATRYPTGSVKIYNSSYYVLPAGFVQLFDYDPSTEIFSVGFPYIGLLGLTYLPAGCLAVTLQPIASHAHGVCYRTGIWPVPVYCDSADENIVVGDLVGPLARIFYGPGNSSYRAIKGGPFAVVKTNMTDTWDTGVIYVFGNIVGNSGKIYKCITPHTSDAADVQPNWNNCPGFGAYWKTYWEQIVYINLDVSY